MTIIHASILALSLLPAAALKPPPVPAPGRVEVSPSAQEPDPAGLPRLPAARRAQYEVVARKCGHCHSIEKALDATFSAEQWEAYLRRKYRRAGAGITSEQTRQIDSFFRYWSAAKR